MPNTRSSSNYSKFSEKDAVDSQSEKFGLKKQIGLTEATAVIAGVIIGSGIFMTPGGILTQVNSVGIWLLYSETHFTSTSLFTTTRKKFL